MHYCATHCVPFRPRFHRCLPHPALPIKITRTAALPSRTPPSPWVLPPPAQTIHRPLNTQNVPTPLPLNPTSPPLNNLPHAYLAPYPYPSFLSRAAPSPSSLSHLPSLPTLNPFLPLSPRAIPFLPSPSHLTLTSPPHPYLPPPPTLTFLPLSPSPPAPLPIPYGPPTDPPSLPFALPLPLIWNPSPSPPHSPLPPLTPHLSRTPRHWQCARVISPPPCLYPLPFPFLPPPLPSTVPHHLNFVEMRVYPFSLTLNRSLSLLSRSSLSSLVSFLFIIYLCSLSWALSSCLVSPSLSSPSPSAFFLLLLISFSFSFSFSFSLLLLLSPFLPSLSLLSFLSSLFSILSCIHLSSFSHFYFLPPPRPSPSLPPPPLSFLLLSSLSQRVFDSIFPPLASHFRFSHPQVHIPSLLASLSLCSDLSLPISPSPRRSFSSASLIGCSFSLSILSSPHVHESSLSSSISLTSLRPFHIVLPSASSASAPPSLYLAHSIPPSSLLPPSRIYLSLLPLATLLSSPLVLQTLRTTRDNMPNMKCILKAKPRQFNSS
ncbi:hypothetical protein C7M84_012929 [Penaeus vannamei]|uniref:Uncharacterized protein n=1 Tax=Penaeus vannamei TaxID=6689 RepID=A0A423SXF4_PENVA|nr:hypothetical protein C7M84_012929 [Penaeus vannamei]